MTTQCPICRSPVEVDDARIGADGVKAQCGLCDEVFLVRPHGKSVDVPIAATSSGGKTSATPSSPASASRRLLEEDAEGAAPRVLVAHDSHAFGELVRELLEEEGYEVEVVHEGETAAKVILERPPLVAILEAGLPKKFGFQLCAEMRAVPDPPPVKFLLVASIYDRKRFAKQPSLATAPDDFLEPRNLEIELLPKVRRLLRGRTDSTASRPAVSGATAARRVDEPLERRPEPARAGTPPPARADLERPSVSRPTVDQDDFKDLFEDSELIGSASASAPAAPADPAALRDVDDILRTDTGAALPASAPSSLHDDEDDLLRSVLEDSVSGSGPSSSRAEPDGEPESRPEPSDRQADDDELLRTLMQMASSEGVEPSKPRLEDDDVLPDDAEDAPPPPRVETDEDALLGGILDDEPVPRERPREDPTGRASPEDLRIEAPTGSVPEVWKSDEEDAKLAARTDEDELEKLLAGDSAAVKVSDVKPAPASAPTASPADDVDDVLRVSEFELDAPKKDPPNNELRDTFEIEKGTNGSGGGFELDDDDGLDALLQADGGSTAKGDAASGVLPASGSSGTPTVLKGPGGTRAPTKVSTGGVADPPDVISATPSTGDGAGASLSSTESIADDDEKSLPEARASRDADARAGGMPGEQVDDELDRLLGGGGGSPSPRAPEVAPTKPGMGPRPVPADDLGRPPAARGSGSSEEHEKARRLAKLIVGDILLYNADRIADAVKSGTFFEVMKGDIKDGRDFYEEKVPEDVRRERDYIQEVLEEVLDRKRKELGLA